MILSRNSYVTIIPSINLRMQIYKTIFLSSLCKKDPLRHSYNISMLSWTCLIVGLSLYKSKLILDLYPTEALHQRNKVCLIAVITVYYLPVRGRIKEAAREIDNYNISLPRNL